MLMCHINQTTSAMTKKSLLFLILACSFQNTSAQDTTHVNLGVMVVPMGHISTDEPDQAFGTLLGVFGVAQFIRGNTVVTPYYAMSANVYGAAIYQQLHRDLGIYVVGNKSILRNDGYAGIGLGTPLASGKATGFIEYGSSWQVWQPAIYIGAFIPIVKQIR